MIQVAQQVERAPARFRGDAIGIRKEQYRIAIRAELHALVDRWQKPASPAGFAPIRLVLAGEQHHESRQIAAFAADAVGQPGTEARPPWYLVAGVHEKSAGSVVELCRMDGRSRCVDDDVRECGSD
jgi:hypothetical protein